METSLGPVEKRRLSDEIVERIVQLISSGAYQVGEKLPSE
jgi:DNA-binding FadR family transcriptional regulator